LYSRKTIVHLEKLTDAIIAAVKSLNSVKNLRASENKLIIELDNPEKENPELVRTIVQAGADVQYVTELKSTLEDVYLKLIREASAE
jgi:ABC-2 type transport system ATP-binding protein